MLPVNDIVLHTAVFIYFFRFCFCFDFSVLSPVNESAETRNYFSFAIAWILIN